MVSGTVRCVCGVTGGHDEVTGPSQGHLPAPPACHTCSRWEEAGCHVSTGTLSARVPLAMGHDHGTSGELLLKFPLQSSVPRMLSIRPLVQLATSRLPTYEACGLLRGTQLLAIPHPLSVQRVGDEGRASRPVCVEGPKPRRYSTAVTSSALLAHDPILVTGTGHQHVCES